MDGGWRGRFYCWKGTLRRYSSRPSTVPFEGTLQALRRYSSKVPFKLLKGPLEVLQPSPITPWRVPFKAVDLHSTPLPPSPSHVSKHPSRPSKVTFNLHLRRLRRPWRSKGLKGHMPSPRVRHAKRDIYHQSDVIVRILEGIYVSECLVIRQSCCPRAN